MTYTPGRVPRAHQTEYFARAAGRRTYANLFDLGCGKTFCLLNEFGLMEHDNEVNDFFLVAPAGSIRNWDADRGDGPDDPLYRPSELRKCLDPATFERLVYAPLISGGSKRSRERVERLLESTGDLRRPRFLSINVEALSTVRAAREAARTFLSAPGRRSMMVVDEATVIGGVSSARSKEVVSLGALADYRRIMSGDLTPNDPLRIYTPFEFLDWRILGHRNWFSFKSRYAVEREITPAHSGRKVKIVVGHRNVDEIAERICPHSFRVLKEHCLDLPPKTYLVRNLEMLPEQRRVYDELKAVATARLDAEGRHATASSVVTQMMKLHGVLCGHVRDDEGVVRDVATSLVPAVLRDLHEARGKVIVWCAWRPLLAKLAAAIEREFPLGSAAQFHGGNVSTRLRDEARFLGDPACRFMLATQAAGGRGNTWVEADLALYASNTQDAEHRRQSEERNYRDGQTKPVTVVDYDFPGTVSSKILLATRRKMDLSALVHGDEPRKWVV